MSSITAVPLCYPDNHKWDSSHRRLVINKEIPAKHLVVCEEGLSILKEISTPVVVISIAGPAGSGKSYLLSQIQNGGSFPVNHGTSVKTTGIWITSPDQQIFKNGQEARLIFLDTDGLGSIYERSTSKDTTLERKLFTLCILMSSYFVFNNPGMPSHDDLLQLDPVISFSHYVKPNTNVPRKRGAQVQPFDPPDLLWLVRDECRQPKLQGQTCSWVTFIKSTILQRREDHRDSGLEMIRKAIIRTFGKIDAMSMPSPSSDPDVIQNLESSRIRPSDLNPAFNRGMQSTANKVIMAATVKTIAGTSVCGNQLGVLFAKYVETLNRESGVIDVESFWRSASKGNPNENTARSVSTCTEQELTPVGTLETVDKLEEQRLIQMACTSYQTKMLELQLPCPSSVFEGMHNSAVAEAEKVFSSMFRSIGGAEGIMSRLHEELRIAIDNEKSSFVENNCCMSIETCEKIAEDLRGKHLTPLTDNLGIRNDYDDLVQAVDKILVEYDKQAIGPKSGYVKSHEQERMESILVKSQRRFIERGVRKAKEQYMYSLNNLRLPASEDDMARTTRNSRTVAIKTFDRHSKGIPMSMWKKELDMIEREIYNISLKRRLENQSLLREKYRQFFKEWEDNFKLHTLERSDQIKRATESILETFRYENTGAIADEICAETEAKYAAMIEKCSTEEIPTGAIAAVGVVAAVGLAAFGIAKLFSGDKEEEEQRRRERQRRKNNRRY